MFVIKVWYLKSNYGKMLFLNGISCYKLYMLKPLLVDLLTSWAAKHCAKISRRVIDGVLYELSNVLVYLFISITFLEVFMTKFSIFDPRIGNKSDNSNSHERSLLLLKFICIQYSILSRIVHSINPCFLWLVEFWARLHSTILLKWGLIGFDLSRYTLCEHR